MTCKPVPTPTRNNHTEQGTGINLTHYGKGRGGGWKYRGNPPNFDVNLFGANTSSISDILLCCEKIPNTTFKTGYDHGYLPYFSEEPYVVTYYDYAHGGAVKKQDIEVAFDKDGKALNGSIDCGLMLAPRDSCDKYMYLNVCGCPEAEIWEVFYNGGIHSGHEDHPDPIPTHSPLEGKGSAGIYSYQNGEEQQNAKYSLKIKNLHAEAHYTVGVLFTHRKIGEDGLDGYGDDPTCIYIFHQHSFIAESCVEYLYEIPFPVVPEDGYFVNLRGIYTQYNRCP